MALERSEPQGWRAGVGARSSPLRLSALPGDQPLVGALCSLSIPQTPPQSPRANVPAALGQPLCPRGPFGQGKVRGGEGEQLYPRVLKVHCQLHTDGPVVRGQPCGSRQGRAPPTLTPCVSLMTLPPSPRGLWVRPGRVSGDPWEGLPSAVFQGGGWRSGVE